MKFGKDLIHEMETCDPEWGPYWMNYKYLKKFLKKLQSDIRELRSTEMDTSTASNLEHIQRAKKEISQNESIFFKEIMKEIKKAGIFFDQSEKISTLRRTRITFGIQSLKREGARLDRQEWNRMVIATVNLYKDVVLIESYALTHLRGFSKIIKKHDKITGLSTKEKFVTNVIFRQNFVKNSFVATFLNEFEKLYLELRGMESIFFAIDDGQLFFNTITELRLESSKRSTHPTSPSTSIPTGNSLTSRSVPFKKRPFESVSALVASMGTDARRHRPTHKSTSSPSPPTTSGTPSTPSGGVDPI